MGAGAPRGEGPELLASLGDLVSPPDAAVLSGDYAEFAAGSFRLALRDGIWAWFDDDLAFIREWGFDLGAIEVPVTIWQGRQDRFVPPAHGEWLAANVPARRRGSSTSTATSRSRSPTSARSWTS